MVSFKHKVPSTKLRFMMMSNFYNTVESRWTDRCGIGNKFIKVNKSLTQY